MLTVRWCFNLSKPFSTIGISNLPYFSLCADWVPNRQQLLIQQVASTLEHCVCCVKCSFLASVESCNAFRDSRARWGVTARQQQRLSRIATMVEARTGVISGCNPGGSNAPSSSSKEETGEDSEGNNGCYPGLQSWCRRRSFKLYRIEDW